MKTIQKILFGALLIGIGCLASTKVVKADGVLTYAVASGLSYNIDQGAGAAGQLVNITADGETKFGITLDDEGKKSGTISPSALLTQLTTTTQKTYAIEAKLGATSLGTESITVYVGNATVDDDTKIEVTSPAEPVRSLDPDTPFIVSAQTLQPPYYVATVGGEANNRVSYTGNHKASDGVVAITAGTATADITFDHTDVSPITATIAWTPNTVSYPFNELLFVDTTPATQPHSVYLTSYTYPNGTITFTGSGSGELTYKAGLTAATTIQKVKDFNFAETVTKVVILPKEKTAVIRNADETFSARVYLDAGETKPASNQKVTWSVSGTAATITPASATTTPTDAAITLKVTGTGDSVTLTATSDDGGVVGTKTLSVGSRIDVTSLTIGHGVTKGYRIDLGYGRGLVTTNTGASVDKIEWTVSSGNDYGSMDSTKTLLTGRKKGTVTLTPKVYYTDGTSATLDGSGGTLDLRKEVSIYDPVVKTNDSSDSIKFTLPSAAFTANTADDNISSVTGYRVDVLNKDGDSVWNDHFSVDSLEGITLNTDKLNEFLRAASGNLSGETHKVKFRISPYSGGTYNSQYDSSDVRVAYRTEEKTAYRGSDGKYSLSNSNNSSSSKGSSAQASASGQGSGNAGSKNGLDKVPKTGEGNARMLIIMIAMISATIAGAILLSYMPARANANKSIAGAEDVKGFFDSTPTTNAKDTNTEQTAANTADKEDDKS